MTSRHLRVRWPLLALLGVVVIWGGVSAWRRARRETEILAVTTCPFFGPPRTTMGANVAPDDTAFVRVHEEVHAAQCRQYGPFAYRWRNVIPKGKLALEVPAYCAAARARLRIGMDTVRVRDRLIDDVTEALSDVADSSRVLAALRENCGEIVRSVGRGKG